MEKLYAILRRMHSRQTLLLFGVLLTILGAKFCLIQGHGSDLPFWDQWDSEGDRLFLSAGRGTLSAQDFFLPHTEHRIVFTKALAYALEKLNGQWDARLEVTVNAVLHVLAIGLLLIGLRRQVGKWPWIAVSLTALLFFSLPMNLENTLGGFQSGFYFLCFFCFAHLAGTFAAPLWSKAWWAGQLAGLCAIFSLGSGLFSALAVLVLLSLDVIRARRITWPALILFCYNFALLSTGLWLRTVVPGHAVLKSHTLAEFLLGVARLIAWPSSVWLLSPLTLFPIAIMVWPYLRRGTKYEGNRFLISLALWWLFQVAALSLARGGSPALLSSRYFDLLAVGSLLAAVSWPISFAQLKGFRTALYCTRALCVAWILILAIGLFQQTRTANAYLQVLLTFNQQRVDTVRGYIFNQNHRFFLAQPIAALPYPDPNRLAGLLQEPAIRKVLPMSVRPSLALAARPESLTGFSRVEKSNLKDAPVGYSIWTTPIRSPIATTAFFQSDWITPPTSRFLRFFVTGSNGSGNDGLWIETHNGRLRVTVPITAGNRWKSVIVDSPKEPFRIVAQSRDNHSLAFTEPVEVAFGSWATRQVIKSGPFLFVIGVALTLFGLFPFLQIIWRETLRQLNEIIIPTLQTGWSVARKQLTENISPRLWSYFLKMVKAFSEAKSWERTQSKVVTLLAIAVILLVRKTDVILKPQFWAEDGPFFFEDARHFGMSSFFVPYAGYLNLLNRIIAEVASAGPTVAEPAVYVYACFGITLLVTASIFSPRLHLPFKPLIALSIVLVPHSGEVFLNLTNLQWITGLGMLIIALKTEAEEGWKNLLEAGVIAVCGLTGPYGILFAPLFLLRFFRLRTRKSFFLAATDIFVALMQAKVLLEANPQGVPAGTDHASMLQTLLYRSVGSVLVGNRLAERLGLTILGIAGGFALFLLGCVLVRLKGFRWEAALLVIAFLLFLFGTAARMAGRQDFIVALNMGDRYFYAPKVIFFWMLCLAAVDFPKSALTIGLGIMALNAPTFRFPPYIDYHWSEAAVRIDRGETFEIRLNPDPFLYRHEDDINKSRRKRPIPLPTTAWLSGAAALGLILLWSGEVAQHYFNRREKRAGLLPEVKT